MAPKKSVASDSALKRKKEAMTVEIKKEIIDKHENGVRVTELSNIYGRPTSTISTILKKKEEIKKLDVAKGVTVTSQYRPKLLEDVEKLLLVWINEKQLKGNSVSETLICAKAKMLYLDLLRKTPGTSAECEEAFKASHGWFENFKKRTGIHGVVRQGEAARSETAAAEKFVPEFQQFITSEGFIPQQVFNCDETEMFWKRMPRRTFITQEEKALGGHKSMKDKLTVLLCANARGDCKIKPLLVQCSEDLQAFCHNNVEKAKLPVMWRANSKAWVTRIIFIEWFTEVFAPTVKKYLEENNLPLKCLLIMDSAPAHPPDLEKYLVSKYNFIKIKFLPPHATPLLQPMEQEVITIFKKLYTKALFSRCIQITSDTDLTIRQFWKDHFNIFCCIDFIDRAWNDVPHCTLQLAWTNLWPDYEDNGDFEGFQEDTSVTVVKEILAMGKNLGLEVNKKDVEKLVEEHRQELTTEELIDLQHQQDTVMQEQLLGEKNKDMLNVSSALIEEICCKWNEVQAFIEKHHHNKTVTNRAVNILNDNVMQYFHKILQQRKRKISQDNFLVALLDNESSCKKQRKIKYQNYSSGTIWEGNHLQNGSSILPRLHHSSLPETINDLDDNCRASASELLPHEPFVPVKEELVHVEMGDSNGDCPNVDISHNSTLHWLDGQSSVGSNCNSTISSGGDGLYLNCPRSSSKLPLNIPKVYIKEEMHEDGVKTCLVKEEPSLDLDEVNNHAVDCFVD
ncbi:DDE superfamily endonuclease domain [Trinorchestia longiramus]|nr:DDE superfamily endonuclease domain [Trinorchestia longiramus]